jgi:hypothetical protein
LQSVCDPFEHVMAPHVPAPSHTWPGDPPHGVFTGAAVQAAPPAPHTWQAPQGWEQQIFPVLPASSAHTMLAHSLPWTQG